MKQNLNLLLIAASFMSLSAGAAEVGEMTAEDTECRMENGNVEPAPGVPLQFQLPPVSQSEKSDSKSSVKAE